MPSDTSLPVIDVSALVKGTVDKKLAAESIGKACREIGFFYISGHGIDESLQSRLESQSRQFFDQPLEVKQQIRMSLGGLSWRGFFPVGNELTSGKPDIKEGIYFGEELPADHPLVKAKTPLHGPNIFPDIAGYRETVLQYLSDIKNLAHRLMEGIAISLGLEENYFYERYTREPTILFRIFNYPPVGQLYSGQQFENSWGVGEHTDYGILTILKQDNSGGLQVKTKTGWIEAPPLSGTFVCNIGDMLDRMTGGLYRSTPHRVISPTNGDRLSFPFFFDPNFNAEVKAIELVVERNGIDEDREQRWDRTSVHEFKGVYRDYLLNKVRKIFPELGRDVL